MPLPELHNFERLKKNKPAPGKLDYPLAIKAIHLDENFKRVTLLESDQNPKTYTVKYTADGVIIKDILGLPAGAQAKQFDVCENGSPTQYWMLVWDQQPEIPA